MKSNVELGSISFKSCSILITLWHVWWCTTYALEQIKDGFCFVTDNIKCIKKKLRYCFVVWSVTSASNVHSIAMQTSALVKSAFSPPGRKKPSIYPLLIFAALFSRLDYFQIWASQELSYFLHPCLYENCTASKFVQVMLGVPCKHQEGCFTLLFLV